MCVHWSLGWLVGNSFIKMDKITSPSCCIVQNGFEINREMVRESISLSDRPSVWLQTSSARTWFFVEILEFFWPSQVDQPERIVLLRKHDSRTGKNCRNIWMMNVYFLNNEKSWGSLLPSYFFVVFVASRFCFRSTSFFRVVYTLSTFALGFSGINLIISTRRMT